MRRIVLLLALAVAGCTYGGEPAPYRPPGFTDPEAAESGAVLYARECAWCHGASGEGTTRGPNLDGELDGGAYAHLMLSTGRMPLPSPDTEAVRGAPVFTEDQIARLVAHVAGFGGTGPSVPTPDPAAGDIALGLDLYLVNCAACHSSTGIGGALTSGRAAPDLTDPAITPAQVAEAMLVGPGCANDHPTCGEGTGAMPRFTFGDEEVDAITAYISYLQGTRNHGGWPIGRIGPVAEGAVAWFLGVSAMLLVGRWIGTRIGEER